MAVIKFNHMKFLLIILIILQIVFGKFSNFTKRNKNQGMLKRNPVAAVFLYNDITSATHKTVPCYWLRGTRQQFKQCRSEPNLATVLNDSRYLTVQQCEDQFRYDRWNCTNTRPTFKKMYRETAFIHALNAATLTIVIAKACADGRLRKCHCSTSSKTNKSTISNANYENLTEIKRQWRWGSGCGDNLQYGRRFTKKFLQLRERMKSDLQDAILVHNSEVGIRTVVAQMREVCKCHGVSGSCSIKTCWRRVPPLTVAATHLKRKYYRAVKYEFNNQANRRLETVGNNRSYKWPKRQLMYLENSPTFCSITQNRNCLNRVNCATLCCGRGYRTYNALEIQNCNCRWKRNFEMICDKCSFEVEKHYCR